MERFFIGLFAGTNGYDILLPVGCLATYVIVRIIEEIRIKRNRRWVLKLI